MTAGKFNSPVCPDMLAEEERSRFETDGYLAFERVLSSDEVDAGRRAIRELVERGYERDRVQVLGEQRPAEDSPGRQQFYIQYEPGTDRTAITLEKCEEHVRKLMWFVDEHPFFQYMVYEHPKIRMMLDTLLHPDAILFQEMMLVKPAHIGGERVWHQDDAYFAVKPLDAVLGMWVAFDDATPENGCMHMLPGGHKRGPLLQSHDVGCTIPADRLENASVTPVPLSAGGGMFLSGLVPHMTPANRTPYRRRAVQFHFRHPQSEIVTQAEYARLFAEVDGTPAACSSWQYRK